MDTDANVDLPMPLLDNLRLLNQHLTNLMVNVPVGRLSLTQIKTVLGDLQRVDERKIIELGYSDSLCPICLTPYNAILSEEEIALAMDSPAHPIEELGIAKLAQSWQCDHIFCRKDITKWITSGHDSCPMCRRQFLQQQASSQSAEEVARAEELTRAEAAPQAVDRNIREVGQFVRRHNELLQATRVLGHNLYDATTRDDNVEDYRGESPPNSGMYS